MANRPKETELAAERTYNAMLYGRLDAERRTVEQQLTAELRSETETPWHRDVAASSLRARRDRLAAAENGLCFGRLEDGAGNVDYIGRLGILAPEREYEPMLLDWRAPAARPFYCATGANREGIARRRQFRTHGREIVDLHDDVLLPEAMGPGDDNAAEGALLAALNAPRGTYMRDVVATIQETQDGIIRDEHNGVVVLEGGPGTGKTAVALHRVAYLLYHHRERLSRRGVLVVGPHAGFLRYISNVLPALGETDVVFATPGELYPGVRATTVDEPRARRVKGSASMVGVLADAVADRQELPTEPLPVELDDVTVPLDGELIAEARERARDSGLPHNAARDVFRRALLDRVTDRAVEQIGAGWLESTDTLLRSDLRAEVRLELADHRQFADAVEQCWPRLTPERLLTELYGSRARLSAATTALSEADCAALYRQDGASWTVSDIALLDEAVEFLGATREPAETDGADVEYARGVLEILDSAEVSDDGDGEEGERLRAVDVVDPETLSQRQRVVDHRSLAERAVADREWAYGHVVVDEAQELSAMEWRVLMRRCPSRFMTIVGDLAQRESPAGTRTWHDMLDDYVPGRWQHRELGINYRTPSEIMEVAAAALARLDVERATPRSVRSTGVRPWRYQVTPDQLPATVSELVDAEDSVAVIAPARLPRTPHPTCRTPGQVKGLEFDAVILVEPGWIEDPADLYVALTRATQRLGVLHTEPLPGSLRGLLVPWTGAHSTYGSPAESTEPRAAADGRCRGRDTAR